MNQESRSETLSRLQGSLYNQVLKRVKVCEDLSNVEKELENTKKDFADDKKNLGDSIKSLKKNLVAIDLSLKEYVDKIEEMR